MTVVPDGRFPKRFCAKVTPNTGWILTTTLFPPTHSTAAQGMRGALLHPTMGTAMKLFSFLLWCCFLTAVIADSNVTLDDSNSLIVYNPPSSWTESESNDLDFGGYHMLTDDTEATATLTFTGTAIYYLSPLWPYRVNTLITLDDEAPVLVSLRDRTQPVVENGPQTTVSQVVWSRDGLDNVEHKLVISVGDGEDVAVVDELIYTTTDLSTSDPSTSSTSILVPTSSSSPLATPTAVSATASSKPAGLSTAIGIVCALFGLLVIGAIFWWWRRRKLQRENEDAISDLPLPPEMAEAASPGRPMWRSRSLLYRDIAAHAAADSSARTPVVPGKAGRRARRAPPPPPNRKSAPALKPLSTIPEVSSGLASGAVLTAHDVEYGEAETETETDAPFAPGHVPAWADVRLVTSEESPTGSGNRQSNGSLDTRREEDPWVNRGQ